jgi:PEP-CTERM motif
MKKAFVLTGAALALAFANLASANITVMDNPTITIGTGSFLNDFGYTYLVQLDGQQQFLGNPVPVGDAPTTEEYCISNIDGLVAGSASIVATPGFSVTQGATGGCNINAGNVGQNVGAWVEILYTGAAAIAPSSALPSVTFYSTFPENTGPNTAYGGSAYSNTANGDGSFNLTHNQGEITGPQGSVPEPATMGLFGSALLAVGFFARRRTTKN